MAKQKGPLSHRGKIGDVVYNVGAYGKVAKTTPKLTEKQRQEKAKLPQNRRTATLNGLATAIRGVVDYYAETLKPGKFYAEVLSHFRDEKSNERVLLLDELNDMEVHPTYQFSKICPAPGIELSISKTNYTAEIELKDPAYKHGSANCFYLQFVLMVWNKEDNHCRQMAESTPWIRLSDKTAKYTTVKFKRTAKDTEYLLACRCVLGVNEVPDGWTSTGMKFFKTGSVTAEGKRLLEEKKAAKEVARRAVPVKEIVKEKPRLKLRDKK